MSHRAHATGFVRILAIVALLATLALQLAGSPARGQIGPADHQGDPRVSYLFGSGSTHGGRPITLRVRLNEPAEPGGTIVALSSERPDLIPLPATVTVPAGETEHTFTNSTNPSDDDTYVRVSASAGGRTMGREVQILEPRLRALYLQSVIRAGGQGKLTVCLSGEAPAGGIAVALTGDNQAVLMVPPAITIEASRACRSIAVDAGEVTEDTQVQVAARYMGVSRFRDTIVRDFSVDSTPTATATIDPTPVFSFTIDETDLPVASGGSVDILVCLTSGDIDPDLVSFDSSSSLRAVEDPSTGTFAAVGDCVEASLTDLEGTGQPSGNARLQVRQGLTLLDESADINFPGDPATPTATATETATSTPEPTATETATSTPEPTATETATNTPEPTATEVVPTATNTAVVTTLSEGCQDINDPFFDSTYQGGVNDDTYTADEVLTITSSNPSSSPAMMSLTVTPNGGSQEMSSGASPGTFNYTIPTSGMTLVSWSVNVSSADWTISCATGSTE